MRGYNRHFERHLEAVEHMRPWQDHGEVQVRAHDDPDQRLLVREP